MAAEPVLLASVVATLGGLAAQVVARVRCICKPHPTTGRCICLSGCTDSKLEHDEHCLDISEYEIAGKQVLLVTGKDP